MRPHQKEQQPGTPLAQGGSLLARICEVMDVVDAKAMAGRLNSRRVAGVCWTL